MKMFKVIDIYDNEILINPRCIMMIEESLNNIGFVSIHLTTGLSFEIKGPFIQIEKNIKKLYQEYL